ncbi:MAG: DsbA family protein [Paracoccaceae bacterium]
MKRTIILVAAVIALLGGGYALYSSQTGGEMAATETGTTEMATPSEDSESTIDTSAIQEMSLGNPDAKVTVIEYASFTCPHCANFHANTFKPLKTNYIDTGKINFIYREVYFDRYGLWAGMVARCGGDLRYFGLADLIYKNQKEWLGGGDPVSISEGLQKLGRTAGLSNEQLDVCLNDGEKAQAMMALFEKNSAADDITGTPSFIINGKKYSNMSYLDFAAVIEEKLAE